ncbi:MAG: DUF357 domain-containing protein [Infirmifilum sp.]|jgi:FAD synthetase|uniref:cytidylyltransferase family protein n=1 Tax=Infirmifilum TaxID=2856573 RepID=UPI0023551276
MEQVCREKASKYISNVNAALETLKFTSDGKDIETVINQARLYLSDSQHYSKLGDCLTAIACASYAEGLLDALRMLGKAEFEWRKPQDNVATHRVLVGGVFDLLHPGHIYFLRKAGEYGKVYVVVARDATVIETKGKKPLMKETDRVLLLNSLKLVEEAFLGDYPPNFASAIERVKPDYVVLGADQTWLKPKVEESLKEVGSKAKIVFIEERIEGYSSSNLQKLLGYPQ